MLASHDLTLDQICICMRYHCRNFFLFLGLFCFCIKADRALRVNVRLERNSRPGIILVLRWCCWSLLLLLKFSIFHLFDLDTLSKSIHRWESCFYILIVIERLHRLTKHRYIGRDNFIWFCKLIIRLSISLRRPLYPSLLDVVAVICPYLFLLHEQTPLIIIAYALIVVILFVPLPDLGFMFDALSFLF